MDRTVALLDWRRKTIITQFVAHDDEWGGTKRYLPQ
jgi:hypothetical protein